MNRPCFDARRWLSEHSSFRHRVAGLLLAAMVQAGCSSSPVVMLHNASSKPVVAMVQVPRIGKVGYPAPASREKVVVASGETFKYVHSCTAQSAVQRYKSKVHVALRRRPNAWQVVSVHHEDAARLNVSIRDGEDGLAYVALDDAVPSKTQELSDSAIFEYMGEWEMGRRVRRGR